MAECLTIFCDMNVNVKTRVNGHYVLTTEIDPKLVRRCARTRKIIGYGRDTAIADALQKGE